MLDRITPVLLTFDEAPNIGRTLEGLRWAREVVVLDGGSSDGTPGIVASFPNARLATRRFDSHAAQWNHAVHETGIRTPWVLALDADYRVEPPFVEELRSLVPPADVHGYSASFVYCVHGRPLRGALYPPVTVLFRREPASYQQDGHTQRVRLPGRVVPLREKLLHDDRKPLGRWLASQDRYMRLEAEKLAGADSRSLAFVDRVRRLALPAPFLVFAWWLVRGGVRDGRAGLHYAWQRTLAEALLALRLVDLRLARRSSSGSAASDRDGTC